MALIQLPPVGGPEPESLCGSDGFLWCISNYRCCLTPEAHKTIQAYLVGKLAGADNFSQLLAFLQSNMARDPQAAAALTTCLLAKLANDMSTGNELFVAAQKAGFHTIDPRIKDLLIAAGLCACIQNEIVSDRNLKANVSPVDPLQVLAKLTTLPIATWNYKFDMVTRHLGPMSQDFKSAFQLGADEKSIAVVDLGGVALAAIQGLNQKIEALQKQVAELTAKIAT